ncbi:MAG TPA: hypothetical protein VGG20_03940 [Thermoanaerobaculia bacterium]|jgi:hypothetical protein
MAPPPPNLPAALLRHAAADPEEPWLFRSEGWDWKWHPWGEAARRLTAWRERLSTLPPGTRAAFHDRSHPETVLLDLAIQAAGLISVPVSRERGTAEAWIEIENGEIRISPSVHSSPSPEVAGGAVVRVGGAETVWTAAELVAAGERLRGEIGEVEGRPIVVLGGPLADPVERTMMAWATLAGAAVVLEPDPALRPAVAAWVRPTLFHGTPGEIADLRARAGKVKMGRLPFRRLETLLIKGTEALADADEAFWEERGVKVSKFSF